VTLLAELRRRNVIRMAGLYLVGAWLVTQVAGTVLPMFDAPSDPRVKAKLVEFGYVAYWRERGWPEGCRALGEADFECGLGAGVVDMGARSR
jgi:hypothetical protein